MHKIYIVKFYWITQDSQDCDITPFEHYEDALSFFLSTINTECTNDEVSWVPDAVKDNAVQVKTSLPDAVNPIYNYYGTDDFDSIAYERECQELIANKKDIIFNIDGLYYDPYCDQADYISLEEMTLN